MAAHQRPRFARSTKRWRSSRAYLTAPRIKMKSGGSFSARLRRSVETDTPSISAASCSSKSSFSGMEKIPCLTRRAANASPPFSVTLGNLRSGLGSEVKLRRVGLPDRGHDPAACWGGLVGRERRNDGEEGIEHLGAASDDCRDPRGKAIRNNVVTRRR